MPPGYITLLIYFKMSPICSALGRVWDLWFKASSRGLGCLGFRL